MHNSNLLPEKLKPGDVIEIVSPSEPVYAEQEVHYAAGAAWLERQGFAVREGNHVRVAPSGEVPTAAQKAEDLNRMFADPEVKAIICSQGGDSAQECLPYIDWNCIRQHPKIFTGISDITVLLNAMYQETGLVTFHGNDVIWGFGRKPQEYDRSEFIDRFVEGAIGDITWLLSDHLGSTSVTVDATGNLLTSLKYTAFGEIRSGDSLTDYQYTGQRNESEIGLYYYIARYYDPQLGRFISADTIIPEAGSSQAYDRYAYVNNNPINFNDPSGHRACDDYYGRGCNVVNPPGGGGGGGSTTTTTTGLTSAFTISSNNLLSEGTIYTTTWVIPYYKWEGLSLADKAEESYTGAGGTPGLNYDILSPGLRLLEGTHEAISFAEDMHNIINRDPIGIELTWQHTENGLLMKSLTVKNYARVKLEIQQINISGGPQERYSIPGPNEWVGVNGNGPGILEMDLNSYLSSNWNSTVHIQFAIAGGYPGDRYVKLFFPAGFIPGPGCSSIR